MINMKIIEVAGIKPAIEAMRLPMKSGNKSDSFVCHSILNRIEEEYCKTCPHRQRSDHDVMFECRKDAPEYIIGPKDYSLSMKLIKSGSEHRKHIRLIDAWMEIEAPLFWWKEFDTYRMGVDKLSESTMHTITKYPFDHSFFDTSGMDDNLRLEPIIEELNELRDLWMKESDPAQKERIWKSVICLLPESYMQKRIVKCSYEALRAMYHNRKNHKLEFWRDFCHELKRLPYSEFIMED